MKSPCVYLLASRRNGTLYVGVTSDPVGRVWQHRQGQCEGFTSRYGVHRLMWFESRDTMARAIAHEKSLKHWRRPWKIALIEENNPDWIDLYPGLLKMQGAC